MDNKELQYNFYNILAVKSGVQQGLHFVYEGRPNEPNVLMSDSKELKKYVCRNLYVFSNSNDADGEIIIENECTCNYGKKIYLRILLKSDEYAFPNEIDKLFTNSNVELDLNNVLQDEDNCIYTETSDGILITFQKPVNVHSSFNGLVKNPIFKEPRNIIEGLYVTVPEVDASGDVIYMDSSGNQVADGESAFPVYTISGDSWMECDNVPYDSDELVPLYSADLSATMDNSLGNAYALMAILLYGTFILLLFFIQGSIYSGVSSLFVGMDNPDAYAGGNIEGDIDVILTDMMKTIVNFERFLIVIGLIIIIIISSVYSSQGKLPVVIFLYDLFIFFFFLTIIGLAYYNKTNTPTFGFTEKMKQWTNDTSKLPTANREEFFNEVSNKWKSMKLINLFPSYKSIQSSSP